MIATPRSVSPDKVSQHIIARFGDDLEPRREAAAAIARRQAAHHDQISATDEADLAIVRLEAEEEHLRDTVWPAASPAQIKKIWARIGALLGEELTRPERKVLAIAPAAEDRCPTSARIDQRSSMV